MISSPFRLFRQFPSLKISLFGKECSGTTEDCARELGFDRVSKVHQIHGNVIHTVRGKTLDYETKGDGMITDQKNHALSVRWADCQGFIVYAPKQNVLGGLHAGWRGMAEKAITALYTTMKQDFGIDPKETFVGITPSICVKCYRFENARNRLPVHLHQFINNDHLDLMGAADAELDALGVPQSQRERNPECTYCGEHYWSWRRDKKEDARNYLVAGIWQDRFA